MKSLFTILFTSISILFAQHEIPCADLKVMLDDALAFHKGDKGEVIEANEYTGITEYKYHMNLSWAQKVSIKEYEFEPKKIKSWGEVLVAQFKEKEQAIQRAELVKEELKKCFTHGVDKTAKEKVEGREYSFVFMVHNQASWTNIELLVTYTGVEYEVYIIF